jgi:hypothetical protein
MPHGEAWQDVIREMGRGSHHAPAVARWADASALARERDQEVVPALPAQGPAKAVGQDAALQIAIEHALARAARGCTFPGPARAVHACLLVERGAQAWEARGPAAIGRWD